MILTGQEFQIYSEEGLVNMLFLPQSALSWNFSLAENLASSILQDGATEWHYSLPLPTPPNS